MQKQMQLYWLPTLFKKYSPDKVKTAVTVITINYRNMLLRGESINRLVFKHLKFL